MGSSLQGCMGFYAQKQGLHLVAALAGARKGKQEGAGSGQGTELAPRLLPWHSPEWSLAVSVQCSVPQQAASMPLGHHTSVFASGKFKK